MINPFTTLYLILFAVLLVSFSSGQEEIDLTGKKFSNTIVVYDTAGNINPIFESLNKTTIIFYFSTQCGTCKDRLKKLISLNDSLLFDLIGIISSTNSKQDISKFYQKFKPDFPVYIDSYESFKKFYGGKWVPVVLVLDKSGKIIFRKVKINNEDLDQIKKLVLMI
jgi:thiol-disulfide isomerase/thioredoxin